jgi:phosphonate transport system ATP-binding protein
VSNAEVFLVDEPLSALDPTLALQTIHVLQAEATARNATLICSLHQVEIARACFTRIVALRDGKIVFDLPGAEVSDAMIEQLYRNKADPAPIFAPVDVDLNAARPRC